LLAAEGGAAGEGDALAPVHGVALGIDRDERRVARLLDAHGELVEHVVPADLLPPIAAGRPVERLLHPAGPYRQLPRRRALGTEPAFVDRTVGIALDLQELRVTLGVLLRVGHERAANGAVRAERVDLFGARDPQIPLDRDGAGEVETQGGDTGGPASG